MADWGLTGRARVLIGAITRRVTQLALHTCTARRSESNRPHTGPSALAASATSGSARPDPTPPAPRARSPPTSGARRPAPGPPHITRAVTRSASTPSTGETSPILLQRKHVRHRCSAKVYRSVPGNDQTSGSRVQRQMLQHGQDVLRVGVRRDVVKRVRQVPSSQAARVHDVLNCSSST
jgi:hypothetical protein